MKTRKEKWVFASLLGVVVGVVHCGGDEAETSAPATLGAAGSSGSAGGSAGKSGAAGSTAGKGGAAGTNAGAAGTSGSSAGTSGAGASGADAGTAGAAGAIAGAAGATAGSAGATAGSAGATAGSAGATAGGAAGSSAGVGGANGGGSAGASGGAAGGAGGSNGGAGGESAGAGGSAAGAAGSAGAGGEPAYPFFNDPKNVVWAESDRFTKAPPGNEFQVEKWLDQGNYIASAEVGFHAVEGATFPKLLNIGPTTVRRAIGLENNGFSFTRYPLFPKVEAGYSLFIHLNVTADPVSFEAFVDCGTKAETADLSSLEHRIYLGRNQTNGLQYSVFDGAGQMKGTIGKADVFTNSSSWVTIGVSHFEDKARLWVNGAEVTSDNVPMPSKASRQQCYLGRSLLRNRPDNHDMVGAVRAVYGFSTPLSDQDTTKLHTYITQRWTP